MPTISTTRGTFHFADHRKAESDHPVLILIHGAGGSRLDWPGQLRKLNTITLDLNGHGESQGNGHDTIIDYARDIVAMMDALEIKQALVAGHSMGGAISQTIALEFPERVAGLLLLGTGAYLPVNPFIIDEVVSNQESVAEALAKWMWSKNTPDEQREMTRTQTLNIDPTILQNDFIACNNFDIRNRLSEIHAPTLVIAGAQDKMVKTETAQELAQKIPNTRLEIIENAGHMMTLEQPERTREIITTWIAETTFT